MATPAQRKVATAATTNDGVEPDPTRSSVALASSVLPPLGPPSSNDNVRAMRSAPHVAIVVYTLYGHIARLAEAIQNGVRHAGGSATIYQIQETLADDILVRVRAPPRPEYPVLAPDDLVHFDAFLFGVPTRYGSFPVQWKAFWDATGPLWSKSALAGKMCAVFVSSGTQGGGQEVTVANALSTFVHHGLVYVPLGYKHVFRQLSDLTEIHGGSPWGAGTFAGMDGSRQPSALELEIAFLQGKGFWETVAKYHGLSA